MKTIFVAASTNNGSGGLDAADLDRYCSEGYGAHSRLHSARILRLSENLPLLIEVVDKTQRIEKVLPILDEMVTEGLVTLETAEVVTYRASGKPEESRG